MKSNLNTELIDGVYYFEIRDVFKKLGVTRFDLAMFASSLFFKQIKIELDSNGYSLFVRINELRNAMKRKIDGEKNYFDRFISFNSYIDKAENVLLELTRHSLVEKIDCKYSISKVGHSLRLQRIT